MTVTEDIIDSLGQQIVDGKYLPNEKLPNERDLAAQFGVARGRIREALRGLSMAGLVEIKRGNGTFVKHPDSWLILPPFVGHSVRPAHQWKNC